MCRTITARRLAVIALVTACLFGGVPACGSSTKVQVLETGTATPSIPADLLAAWSTVVKMAVDDLRSKHLASGGSPFKLIAAARFTTTICRSAVDDLRSARVPTETLQSGCETALRAGATPPISAASIYEQADAAFAYAGSLLSLTNASDASQARIVRTLLAPLDPNSIDLSSRSQRDYLGERIKVICTSLVFRASIDSVCQDLVRELQRNVYPDATTIGNDWNLLRGN